MATADDSRWLVVVPTLYGLRGALEGRFVATFANRPRPGPRHPTVDTYELVGE
jgi:hypothetical protein